MRTCPHCGHTEQTYEERCPACGASFFDRPPRLSPGRRRALRWGVALAGAAALATLLIVALTAKSHRDARNRVEFKQAVAADIARLKRVQTPHHGSAVRLRPPPGATTAERLKARGALVLAVEHQITLDARHRVQTGELSGRITGTRCGPFLRAPNAIPDDRVLSKQIGRYDCVAIQSDVGSNGKSVASLGTPFVAALDFRRFTYVWCRNNPPQSEGGKSLAFVRLARACLAAKGRAVGTGYVDVPDS